MRIIAMRVRQLTVIVTVLLASSGVALGFAVLPAHGAQVQSVAAPAWLARINEIRTASGLLPVTKDAAWSTGIAHHLIYLAKTPRSMMTGAYANAHTENPASPYYTRGGAREAARSDIAYSASSGVSAIDEWIAAPFHAIGMLRPGLRRVAFARNTSTGDAALDVLSGLTGPRGNRPVLFPGPRSTIDLSRFGGETPDPTETCRRDKPGANYTKAGLAMIAMLPTAPSARLKATLTRPNGTRVASTGPNLCVVDERTFTSSDKVYGPEGRAILKADHAVLLIPRTALQAGRYTVAIRQPGRAKLSWRFTEKPRTTQPT
jgi:hypothetical protein